MIACFQSPSTYQRIYIGANGFQHAQSMRGVVEGFIRSKYMDMFYVNEDDDDDMQEFIDNAMAGYDDPKNWKFHTIFIDEHY